MKYRMKNPFITLDGVLHAKGDVVDLNEQEAKVGLSFRAIEVVPDTTQQAPESGAPVKDDAQ